MRTILSLVLLASALRAQVFAAEAAKPSGHAAGETSLSITMPGGPLGIAWGFLYGYSGAPADTFLPTLRELGGGFSKVYLFWEQIEPHAGEFNFTALDTYVNQLRTPEEGLVSIFSASSWATEKPSTMLPPSPARDLDAYYRMVHAAVAHVRGRVRYWQNDCEPNSPIYWAGTKEQFVAQLKVFHRAVKDADPDAVVVVGGFDGLFNPPGMWEFPTQKYGLEFFDHVFHAAGQDFDVFDLRLYADPYTITPRVAHMREMMRAAGCEHPIICTEYNGPGFFEFMPNLAYIPLVQKWGAAAALPEGPEREAAATAIRGEIATLYEKMTTLAPQTQIFLQGCPPALEAKLRRLQGRDLVFRNLFALASGVQKTLYWDLWHDTSSRDDMMTIMYGKLKLMERTDVSLTSCNPTTEGFRRLAAALHGVESVRRRELPGRDDVFLFDVARHDGTSLLVAWQRRDAFTGEDQPAVAFAWPSTVAASRAEDAFGQTVEVRFHDGQLEANLTDTPVFIELAGAR